MTKRTRTTFTNPCPFTGCSLRCSSRHSHRAKYAFISHRWKEKVAMLDQEVIEMKSKRINYEALKELGILWPLTQNAAVPFRNGDHKDTREDSGSSGRREEDRKESKEAK